MSNINHIKKESAKNMYKTDSLYPVFVWPLYNQATLHFHMYTFSIKQHKVAFLIFSVLSMLKKASSVKIMHEIQKANTQCVFGDEQCCTNK